MSETKGFRMLFCIVTAMLATVLFAIGGNKNWELTGTNDWETGTNWDPDGVPASVNSDDAKLFNGGTARITQDGQSAQSLTLAFGGGDSGHVRMESGSLAISQNQTLGRGGTGTFTQLAGTNTAGADVVLGEQSGGFGGYYLQGGSFAVNNGHIRVGHLNGSTGEVVQTGGRLEAMTSNKYLYLGVDAGSTGSYTMSGSAVVALTNTENYIFCGEYGTGTFIQSNGTVAVKSYVMVGRRNGSTGCYRIEDGTLDIDGWLVVGEEATATGTFEVKGTAPTITVGGQYSQNSLSALKVELNASGVSPITVSGAATVNGSLTVAFDGTDYGDLADTVTIINAAGLSGTFTSTNVVAPLLGVEVVYDVGSGDVKLTNFEFPPTGTIVLIQ
ncbi:MAG: hypothetical protein HQ523_12095 [Lentisphaerae bacterium]|nr:hypothetical protein [Lentisphaerota bacterium]